jgi:hypothetical protein
MPAPQKVVVFYDGGVDLLGYIDCNDLKEKFQPALGAKRFPKKLKRQVAYGMTRNL